MKNNKTKGRILDKSIEMFNDRHASNVSTVQISKCMGISPGNLYYYYSNKEEIIRMVWEERICEDISVIAEEAGTMDSEEKLREYCKKYAEHCSKYRFFYLEMPTLFANDEELKKSYLETAEKEKDFAVKVLNDLTDAGIIEKIDGEYKEITGKNFMAVIKNAWIDAFCFGKDGIRDIDEISADAADSMWERIKAFIRPYIRN